MLTVRDVTRPVILTVDSVSRRRAGVVHGPGATRIDRTEFGDHGHARPGRAAISSMTVEVQCVRKLAAARPAARRPGRPGDGGRRTRRPAVAVTGLRKSYGGVPAVRGVSFRVASGEIFALLGPNGAGKTSMLEILEGFRGRDGGQVDVLGLDPADRSGGRALRERIGLVLQDIAVEPYLTVRETVARNAGYYPAPRDVGEVISLVGLAGKERQKVRNLSGGQKRRLDLALGLMGNPELLFLDEPTTGFDPSARRDAWEIVRGLRAAGTTILLTTHYMEEAQELADRVAVLSGGEIVAEGTPATIGGRDTAADPHPLRPARRVRPGRPAAGRAPGADRAGDDLVAVETARSRPGSCTS